MRNKILIITLLMLSLKELQGQQSLEISTAVGTQNRYEIRHVTYVFENGEKYNGYLVSNLSNKIKVDSLYERLMPSKYKAYDITPGYHPSINSMIMVDSLIIAAITREKLEKVYLNNIRRGFTFSVVYDLSGKLVEVDNMVLTSKEPISLDIREIEKMEEILKSYADYEPRLTSAISKELLEVYAKINYFRAYYYFSLVSESDTEKDKPKEWWNHPVPKFNTLLPNKNK